MSQANALKLLADDSEGLGIVSAAVQDALVKPEGIKFDRKGRAFALELNRFQWERAGKRPPFFRSRAVLAFAGVLGAQSMGLSRDIDDVHSILSLSFAPGAEAPAGEVTIRFAGGGVLKLACECVDVTLLDTGPTWPTRRKPDHGTKA